MKTFLLDAVENDDTEAICENISEVPTYAQELILKAIRSSSSQMLVLLLDACIGIPINELDVLESAAREGMVEAVRILLSRGASVSESSHLVRYFAPRNPADIIQLFLQHDYLQPDHLHYDALFQLASLLPSAYEPESEAKIIKCLDLIQPWRVEKGELSEFFRQNGNRCFSIAIARLLLQSGVDVNTRGAKERSGANTALYAASAKKGQRAAEFMRFLLESGADPSLKTLKSIAIADRPGPKEIEKWLGISWDQLVQDSAKVYAASLPAAGEKERSIQDNGDAN